MLIILSDIHANYFALESIDRYISNSKFDSILCAGDLVGYYTRPNETINWIRTNKVISVLGNHDKAIFDNAIANTFNIYAKKAISWTKNNISIQNSNYLKKLPIFYDGVINGKRIYMVHGSPLEPLHDYIFSDDVDNNFLTHFFEIKPDIIILGQTHRPFIKKVDETLIINPGSVGQPRDNNNKTSFVICDEQKVDARIVRLNYDIETLIKETREHLPEKLVKRIIEGK